MEYETSRTTGGTTDTTGSFPSPSVTEQARQVVEQIPEKAGEIADRARDQAKTQLTSQKDRAAGGLESAAQALRQASAQMRDQDQLKFGSYAEAAAEQMERFSHYLRHTDITAMTREVESFARRQPALFLGGAFALGFMAARFLKSSSEEARWAAGGGYEGNGGRSRYGSFNGPSSWRSDRYSAGTTGYTAPASTAGAATAPPLEDVPMPPYEPPPTMRSSDAE